MAQYGREQVQLWRRSYAIRPPPMPEGHPWNPNVDPRYGHLAPDVLPKTESLADVVVRLLPYWYVDRTRKLTAVANGTV